MNNSNEIQAKRILKWNMKKKTLLERLEEARSVGNQERIKLLSNLIKTTENKISEIKGSDVSA
ncbi:hypothetical protein SAMN06265827_10583 [Orenia metallireducens]|uniref:Uncharacterized protein n=1 Tax=Orenia metallireducens TaxID=1413210 RepID=A0A285G9X8_9FIRM|nr:hypothetical protein [Orenia metallireducens]SNY19221.1 hypothetical protein SAMN06265827_10583 [Orenia metallireducens]